MKNLELEEIRKDIKYQEYLISLKKDYHNLINNSSYKKIIENHLFDIEVKKNINSLNVNVEHDSEILHRLKSINYLKQFLDNLFIAIEKAQDELIDLQFNLNESIKELNEDI